MLCHEVSGGAESGEQCRALLIKFSQWRWFFHFNAWETLASSSEIWGHGAPELTVQPNLSYFWGACLNYNALSSLMRCLCHLSSHCPFALEFFSDFGHSQTIALFLDYFLYFLS